MAMLDRYKKPGGFLQLLNLIETCGPQKQEKFLKIIEEENPRWAKAIQQKMITIDKIFSWNEDTLREIFSRLQELTLATALHGFGDERSQRVIATFSHSQKRRMDDLMAAHSPNPAEISTTFMKIIEEIRSMISQGYLRLDKIDPQLVIDEDIEDKLIHSPHELKLIKEDAGSTSGSSSSDDFKIEYDRPPDKSSLDDKQPATGKNSEELNQLRKKLILLNQENTALKQEVRVLRDKLDKIRRIA